jgi:hypothetical protein
MAQKLALHHCEPPPPTPSYLLQEIFTDQSLPRLHLHCSWCEAWVASARLCPDYLTPCSTQEYDTVLQTCPG